MSDRSDAISPAIHAVLQRCQHMVRGVAIRHRLSEADIEQVFQEVRIRLWRALASGETIARVPASYVYRTATSAALDLIRRRQARREEVLDTGRDSSEAMRSPVAGPDEGLEGTELSAKIAQAVDGLIESRRQVVRMYLLGYSKAEIAAVMGWSQAKTRNLLYRGLADLRTRLTELGLGPGGAL